MVGKPEQEIELSQAQIEELLVDIYKYKLRLVEMSKDKANRQSNFEKEAKQYIRPFFEFSEEVSQKTLVEAYVVYKLMKVKGIHPKRLDEAENRAEQAIKNKKLFDSYRQNINHKSFAFETQLVAKSTLENLKGAAMMLVKLLNHLGIKTQITIHKSPKEKISKDANQQISAIAKTLDAARDTRDKEFEELDKWAWEGKKKAEQAGIKKDSKYSELDELLKSNEEEELDKWAWEGSLKSPQSKSKKEGNKELDELLKRNNPFDSLESVKHIPGTPNPFDDKPLARPKRPAPQPPRIGDKF